MLHIVGTSKVEAGGAVASKDTKRISSSLSLLLVIIAAGLVGIASSIKSVLDSSPFWGEDKKRLT